ncbi:MAG TPA: YlxR family protein [Chthonomonadales bacterium]|nr:YlxR family protein [Chthonomonadales bacterium]
MRTCVACRTTGDKRGLLRVVRQPDGHVVYDRTGKQNGRGAYVCANVTCVEVARKQKKLERSLRAEVKPEVFEELLVQAEVLQKTV